ncbi:hypothetical protein PoB_007532000 [Plakobranchus ocellatus]|uniref:Uncharacterized protein n=1 Tax=Plakobranchus ocellatus TaxID=259542 RepID=A0AAV4DXS5_9GAST|nr:hypothetical protein PoB_007532000 [Plakobranchus ocellatus]
MEMTEYHSMIVWDRSTQCIAPPHMTISIWNAIDHIVEMRDSACYIPIVFLIKLKRHSLSWLPKSVLILRAGYASNLRMAHPCQATGFWDIRCVMREFDLSARMPRLWDARLRVLRGNGRDLMTFTVLTTH